MYQAYRGTSMSPILSEQDLLEIAPYGSRPVKAGDVIVFVPPGEDRYVVHRVFVVSSKGIRSRGDISTRNDSWLLQSGHIAGRVVAAWRGQRRRRIAGGFAGRLVVYFNHWQRFLGKRLSPILHPAYDRLSRSKIPPRLLPPPLRPRVISFQHNGQSCLSLLIGRRVIGRYDPRQCKWQIQRPFRLLVDEPTLPDFLPKSAHQSDGGSTTLSGNG